MRDGDLHGAQGPALSGHDQPRLVPVGGSNETVADKFREVGFEEVTVWGSGRRRAGTALWPKEDATDEIPDEITDIQIEV
ncbi:MAG: hypothetical protein ACR2J1_09165 [Methyloceanibacter sp.]|uniref:hypothetical protein n=1 Tax=Methyloceanibacter sp. TaxID=1965321 RepID=UPI003D9B5F57